MKEGAATGTGIWGGMGKVVGMDIGAAKGAAPTAGGASNGDALLL